MQVRLSAFLDSQWASVLEGFVVGTGIGIGVWAASWVPLWWETFPAFALGLIGWCCAWLAIVIGVGRALLSVERRFYYPSYNPKKHKLHDD